LEVKKFGNVYKRKTQNSTSWKMGAVKVNVPQVFYVDVRGKKRRRTNSTEKKSKGRRTNDGEKVNKVVSRRNFLFFLWLLLPANNAVMYIRNVQKIPYFIESADS